MRIITDLDHYQTERPAALTIGNFDGVHRGHQALITSLLEHKGDAQSVVITFSNHPSQVLRPDHPVELLCSLPQKIKLLEDAGIDTLVLFEFTPQFSQQTAAEFVHRLARHIPLRKLVLGHDATLGRDRQGDKSQMAAIAEREGFSLTYIPEYEFQGHSVNSTTIREALRAGDFRQVELLLGRPYSIYQPKQIPDQPNHFDLGGLCLPPDGDYQCHLADGTPLSITIRNKTLYLPIDHSVNVSKLNILF